MAIGGKALRQPVERAARLSGLLACGLLAAGFPANASAAFSDLQGIWDRQQVIEPSDHPRVVEIGDSVLRADGAECRIAGLRSLSDHRWYLDASCGSAESPAIVQFDLLLLDQGRLLVARRVLGTAELYVRRPRGGAKQ